MKRKLLTILFLLLGCQLYCAEHKEEQKNGVVSKIQMIPTASYIIMHKPNECSCRQGIVWRPLPTGRCRNGHKLLEETAIAQQPGNCLVTVYNQNKEQIAYFVAQEELVRERARVLIDPKCLPCVTSVYIGRNSRRKNEIEARCYCNDTLLTIYPIPYLFVNSYRPEENVIKKELVKILGNAFNFSDAEIHYKFF